MDSFTQILLGIATVEVIAGRQLQNRTFAYGALLGTIPDLDVVAGMFIDPISGIAIHRGFSHSLLLFLILSPLLGFVMAKIERGKISLQKAIAAVFFGLLTHVILDIFTSWGTQILWPLPSRFALKTIFVIDPLYTLPLMIALVYVFKQQNYFLRRRYVVRGIIFSSAYLLFSCTIKLVALYKFEQALRQQQISYVQIMVKPTAFNTIVWNANVATPGGYLLADYSLFDSKPIKFTFYENDSAAEKQIATSPAFKQLVCISEGWYIVSNQNKKITFNDLRFGLLNDDANAPVFAFSYEFRPIENAGFIAAEIPKAKRDGKVLLQKLWIRLQGN